MTLNAGIADGWTIPLCTSAASINGANLSVVNTEDDATAMEVHRILNIAGVTVPVIASRNDSVFKAN